MSLGLGNVDLSDILAEISEDVQTESLAEEPNLTEEELTLTEKSNNLELAMWNIVKCKACESHFDMLACKYDEGNLVCPHCHTVQI